MTRQRVWPFGLAQLSLLSLVSLICVVPRTAFAQPLAASFEAANKLYEEGKFTDAATAYQKLLEGHQVSAALWFNLGNAYFKSGQIGRALAAYVQARGLTPRDPDVRANLQFARNQASGPTLPPSRWGQWLAELSLNEWASLTGLAFWLEFLALGLVQFRPSLKPALRTVVIALGVATLLLGGGLAAAFRQAQPGRLAIVVARDATVHHGPLAESPMAFTVHDGAELQVLDRKDQWLEVTAGPRRNGWVRQEDLILPR